VSDRRSRRVVFAAGLALFAAAYLGFGVAGTAGWLWLLLPLYGGYTALTDGVSRAWIADVVPPDQHGTALGIQAAVSGVGLLIAGVWAGLAWNGTGRTPFIISGLVAATIAAGLLVARGREWS
jgi:MFS family permease